MEKTDTGTKILHWIDGVMIEASLFMASDIKEFDGRIMTRDEYTRWFNQLSPGDQAHVRGHLVQHLGKLMVRILIVGLNKVTRLR